jgi:hypothetical protein
VLGNGTRGRLSVFAPSSARLKGAQTLYREQATALETLTLPADCMSGIASASLCLPELAAGK